MSGLGLQGKRVVVTGAAGGLGRAFAQAFANEGAVVLACDMNLKGCEETVARMGAGFAQDVDVTDAASCQALAQFADKAMGGTDVLVNNAAIYLSLIHI